HLLAYALDDIIESEAAFLLSKLRMINRLKQQIPEFLTEVRNITARDGIGDFVSLLEGIGSNRIEALFEVPWAAGLGRTQRLHYRAECFDAAGIHLDGVHANSCNSHNAYYGRYTLYRLWANLYFCSRPLARPVCVESSCSNRLRLKSRSSFHRRQA